ncbi:MAG TPA: cyclic nucleotide-binding domain-containing protein [Actinomycetota bacterium]|nr:cyclic nucleotide-binding domain-containing protein [Actinomycetota bacterium]
MGDDVFDGLTGVVPGAIARGGVGARSSGAGRRVDRPLSRHDVHMLAGVPLFAGLSRRHLRRLAEHADLVSFREGQAVVRQDQAGGTFYVIVQGEAKVQRHGRTIGTLGPGEFFGEISLLDGGPRTADVVAATPLVAIRIFKQAFDRVVVEERGVAAEILAVVARRLRESERSLHS